MSKQTFTPNKIISYFKTEWVVLLIVTVSGLIYNLGLLAGPWFEGRMTGCLIDILNGRKTFYNMLILVGCYVLSIAVVQVSRYIKRFYVRRFANNVNRRMKGILYASLVEKSRPELKEQGTGDIMTKAILDIDDCVEGMRKFTTEIFDTGIALAAYAGMLLYYDWRLALLSMLFPPVSYLLAEKMKAIVQRTGVVYKEQSGALSSATLDRAENAITYRVFGCEQQRKQAYEENLTAYEKAAVSANIWNTMMPPLYKVISMTGVLFILYFGAANVLGIGWKVWTAAIFTTFLSCFTKLSVKSSNAAKLFNAVHKAQVSWKRIKPLMNPVIENEKPEIRTVSQLSVQELTFAYPDGENIFENISLAAKPGDIIGVTGAVACGKSTFGKAFLGEYPYQGSITVDGKELGSLDRRQHAGIIGYLGHAPELFNDTIENNILMGENKNVSDYLKLVCFNEEVQAMPDKENTMVGNGGVRLSGGQAQRLALARTLCHKRPVLILDAPFSALDKDTEKQIFVNLKKYMADGIVIIISHRLYLFPQMNQVIWMENGKAVTGTHEKLMQEIPEYAQLYHAQEGGSIYEQ